MVTKNIYVEDPEPSAIESREVDSDASRKMTPVLKRNHDDSDLLLRKVRSCLKQLNYSLVHNRHLQFHKLNCREALHAFNETWKRRNICKELLDNPEHVPFGRHIYLCNLRIKIQ